MDSRFVSGQSPGFSAVIPTYNRAGPICDAIDSVLEQTHPAGEIIVVDDGSRDATRERLQAYQGRVRYIYQENAGAAAARNRGAAEARFPWLAFLDSDDIWSPTYLEKMASAIAGTDGAAVLYFADAKFEELPPPKNRWARVGFEAEAPYKLLENPVEVVLAESQPMLLPFSVFQRSAFLAMGGLWERLSAGEDTHLYVRLGLAHPICAVSVLGGVVKGAPEDAGRLTGALGPLSIRHWDCSILLWKDILRKTQHLAPRHRRLLVRRVADAYWRKSILSAQQHQFVAAARSFGRSLVHDPSVAFEAAARKIGSR
jgi:glycosyltransferase involved in cell wall biosynthesis